MAWRRFGGLAPEGVASVDRSASDVSHRAAEPGLREVQTWNAQHNESMLKVNAELGFQPDRDWYEYCADVAQLVQSLEPTD